MHRPLARRYWGNGITFTWDGYGFRWKTLSGKRFWFILRIERYYTIKRRYMDNQPVITHWYHSMTFIASKVITHIIIQ